jgi:hypothetical protein
MYLEAFSEAKNPQQSAANEDRLVIILGKAYGVIDGVTDKSGRLYDGLSGGQVAGLIIEQAIGELIQRPNYLAITKEELVDCINQKFVAKYIEAGIEEFVQTDPNAGFAAQLALVLKHHGQYKVFLIGDCGLRLNGHEVFWPRKIGDEVSACIRAYIYSFLEARGATSATILSLARHYVLEGLKEFPAAANDWISLQEWDGLKTQLLTELTKRFPQIEQTLIRDLLSTGIRGQAKYRNLSSPLGSACIDGSPIPPDLIMSFERASAEVNMIELFSDGYFGFPEETTVMGWEKRFSAIEQEDPAKVKRFPSTKGSADGCYADDRSVLILKESFVYG